MDLKHSKPDRTGASTAALIHRRSVQWKAYLRSIGDGRFFLIIAGPLLTLYLLTVSWGQPFHIDTTSNDLTAWSLGTHGTFLLDDHVHMLDQVYEGNVALLVRTSDSAVSQYPPGAALLAAPLYAVWPEEASVEYIQAGNRPGVPLVDFLIPPTAPSAITAALSVAAAIGFLGVAFRRLSATPEMALLAAYLAGLGTSAWSVAADKLWQHGPGMLWIALAAVLAERHTLASGFAYGAAVLTRPTTAVIAAATGFYRSWRTGSIRPAVLTAIGGFVGLGLLLAYNDLIFGSPSLSGGYGTGFGENTLSGDLLEYARNLFLGAFSATRGFLVWSPFLLVLLPGLRSAWRVAPAWVRGSALGGLLYLLLQYKANRFSGGFGFFTYRYPLEALTAAAPLLFLSFQEWVLPRPRALELLAALSVTSVVIHSLGAVL